MRHAALAVTAKAHKALVEYGHQPSCGCPGVLFEPPIKATDLHLVITKQVALSISNCAKVARCGSRRSARIALAGMFRRADRAAAQAGRP